MLDDKTAKIVIKGKTIIACANDLGLKQASQGWKLLEGASLYCGDLASTLKNFNTTTDSDRENNKITTAINRLNNKLMESMGLQSNPIIFNGTYKFTFRTMTHELLDGKNITKSPDAMTPNYRSNKEFDENELSINDDHDDSENNSFWSDDEPDEYY